MKQAIPNFDFENFDLETPGRDNLDSTFEKTKELAQKGWEAVKQKYNSAAEIVNLNTFDKWKVLSEKAETNKVIAQRTQYVADLEGRLVTGERNIQYYENLKATESAKFGPAIGNISDPHIKDIFINNLNEKLREADLQIQHTETVMQQIRVSIENQTAEIAMFQQRIQEAGAAFTERLDTRIEQIRQKHKYEQWQECLRYAHSRVNECVAFIAQTDRQIAEYNGYLTTARQLDVKAEDCKTIEAGITAFNVQRKEGVARDARYRKMFTDSQKRIQEIDGKTAKYENIKRELNAGVTVSNSVPTPHSVEPDVAIPDPGIIPTPDETPTVHEDNHEDSEQPIEAEEETIDEGEETPAEIVPIPQESNSEHDDLPPAVPNGLYPSMKMGGQVDDGIHPSFEATDPDEEYIPTWMRLKRKLRVREESEVAIPKSEIMDEQALRVEASKQLGEVMMHIHDTHNTDNHESTWNNVTKLSRIFEGHRGLFESSLYNRISKDIRLILQRYHDRDTSPENDARVKQELKRDVDSLINGALYDWVASYGGITKKNRESQQSKEIPAQEGAVNVEATAETETGRLSESGESIEPPVESQAPETEVREDERRGEARKILGEMIDRISKTRGSRQSGKLYTDVQELHAVFEEYKDQFEVDEFSAIAKDFEKILLAPNPKNLSSRSFGVRQQLMQDVGKLITGPLKDWVSNNS